MSTETKAFIGIGLVTIIIVVGAAFFVGGKSSPDKESPKLTAEQTKMLIRSTSHKTTDTDTKVTIVEFGDFQCPACGAAHPIVAKLLEDYKGKITFVFREFPLPMHPNGKIAAEAAEAAGSQGKFFQMHDKLYDNQKEWAESKNPMDYFVKYAKEIGLKVDYFTNDMKSNTYNQKIQNDVTDGNALGVNATPTFFINGQIQAGGLPYDEFKAKIDAALKSS